MKDTISTNAKAALIVGGANGLGAKIAQRLSARKRDKKIIIADKNAPDYQIDNCEFINIDLFNENVDKLTSLDIDTLIVTAGIGRLSAFETFSSKEIDKNFIVNTLPFIKLVLAYYNRICTKEDFYTCIISSITGVIASPLYSVYSASKAALVKFCEAINAELEYYGYDNRLLDVAPGNIAGTGFHGDKPVENPMLTEIADSILDNMYNKKALYIPNESVYGQVIKNYQKDGHAFALDSIKYKLEKNKLNDKPQIKVGYLTGTFDLFHVGHLNLLRNAKRYCDKLIVGIHPDAKHKNKEVFIPLDERIDIVKNIKYVDDVIVCTNEDIDAYPTIKYDYLFVGSDYQGTERFKRYEQYFSDKNVKIIYLPYTTKTSSTQLRSAISAKIGQE